MRRLIATPLLFFILICLAPVKAVHAQAETAPLQLGMPVERTITRGKAHNFTVSLERNQILRLVVEQRGIDVVVRVISPSGKSLGDFDSPNGTEGPENVSVIAEDAGLYLIQVVPLEQEANENSGRYEIRVLELRAATKEELESIKDIEAAKVKAIALVTELAASLQQIRLPETRVRLQIQTAQTIKNSDEKLASKLMSDAIEGVKEYIASIDANAQNYEQSYQLAMQLRNELITALAPSDPELALNFLCSTRTLMSPNGMQDNNQQAQELQMELSLANKIAEKDSKRALQIAEESLKKGYSYNFVETLMRLQAADAEGAAKLAVEIADKLQNENLLKNQEAANLTVNLLQVAKPQAMNDQSSTTNVVISKTGLLPEQKYRELFNRALASALSYNSTPSNYYTPERTSAQNILNSLKSMTAEMQRYAPERAATVEKRATELTSSADPQSQLWQKYQETIGKGSLEEALELVTSAPKEMRDQLYQQVAMKAMGAGDYARARQILSDNIKSAWQRREALRNLDRQAVYSAMNKGNVVEALRSAGNLSAPIERAQMLIQIVNQSGPTQKRATSLEILEQARALIGNTGRAESQMQMNALFELARAYLRFEPKRCAEIIEPLVDQLNEMSVAAVTLNDFGGQQYYREGELVMQNGNTIAVIANQLNQTLGALAAQDFDHAKSAADKIARTEARLFAYLAIAQQAIGQNRNERIDYGNINRFNFGK